jgi:hypothetical protein
LRTTHTKFSRRSQVPTKTPQQATAPLTAFTSDAMTLPVPSASLVTGWLWDALL